MRKRRKWWRRRKGRLKWWKFMAKVAPCGEMRGLDGSRGRGRRGKLEEEEKGSGGRRRER